MTDLQTHLDTGTTTLCWCWRVTRRDGVILGFTDHDGALEFDGTEFRADSGFTAKMLQQNSGLSVDNTEAMGVLSDDRLSKADILAGRFDGADVEAWRVNWQAPEQRIMVFRGAIGEITQSGGQFTAELRGLTDLLNQPQGRFYQEHCSAVLGDSQCRFVKESEGYSALVPVSDVDENGVLMFSGLSGYADGWFEHGLLTVQTGAAAGLTGYIKSDKTGEMRTITLWQSLHAPVADGDMIRLDAGCDKRAETCRAKFGNFLNFGGFPHIPGEDWLMSYPKSSDDNSGQSLNS